MNTAITPDLIAESAYPISATGQFDSKIPADAHPPLLQVTQLVPRRPGERPRLATIPGTVPELAHLPAGCPFAGRCGFTMDACHTTPPPPVPLGALGALGAGHMARCIRLDAMPAAPEVGA